MPDENVSQVLNNQFPKALQAYSANQPRLTEWTNHSSFYAVYPTYYFTFANQWLRKWLAWFDGYVPGIHDGSGGIISTRLATTLCYRLAEQVFGGGLLYTPSKTVDRANKALEFISGNFAEDIDIDGEVLKALIFAAAGGTSYLKTNVDNKQQVWIDTWRADQAYCDIDFKGEVARAKFLIAKFVKTVPQQGKEENFFLVEDRFYATERDNKQYKKKYADKINKLLIAPKLTEDKPYVTYKIYRLQGQVNNFDESPSMGRELEWEELPDDIKRSIKQDYGVMFLNVPQLLPFTDLGVDAVKWSSFISNLPQLPYGESLVAKVQSYLFEYDFMNSCMNTDFYLGRGRVLVPKSLQSPKARDGGHTYNQGLDDFLFTKVEYQSTEDKKPEAIQFELRSQEWLNSRNHLLECIATAIGISPSTIASYLNDSSARTAREISSEESSTALYVENRRKLIKKPLNRLIARILLFNGYPDAVTVKFSKSGQTNTTLLTENTTSQYSAGLISQYQAVKNLNPDMSEEELQAEIARINDDSNKKNNMFGGGFDENIGGFVNGQDNNVGEEPGAELASIADRTSPDADQDID